MNVPTCYRCPERHPDKLDTRKRCPILQGKLDAVKGAGLSSIAFKCDKRQALFQPGEVVEFRLLVDDEGGTGPEDMTGIVMATKGRKVRIYSETTNRPVIALYPDMLKKTGETHTVCIHCGRPKGKEFEVTSNAGEKHKWECLHPFEQCVYQEPA